MTDKDNIFVERWSRSREKGKLSFMLRVGVLWGIITVIVTQLFKLDKMSFKELFLSELFLVKLLIFLLAGIFGFALILWVLSEKKYRRLKSNKKD
jgi:hypothetical protein